MKEVRDLKEKNRTLDETVRDYKSKFAFLETELAAARQSVTDRDATIERLQKEIDELSEQNHAVRRNLSEVESQLDLTEQDKEELVTQLQSAVRQIAELKADMDKMVQEAEVSIILNLLNRNFKFDKLKSLSPQLTEGNILNYL